MYDFEEQVKAMPKPAIVVESLSKRYLIGHRFSSGQYKYTALRDVLGRKIRNFVRKTTDLIDGRQVMQGDEIEEFWALKDASFEVRQGEVLGLIGRNGAGKSTLLKILSRITEPTRGRVTLRGRVSSLLEVGTGFHPELTGRENIFLNGAILGMTQREIRKKFDEIAAFAEVEKFLDTPVKHYSSGLYVRLAFAVAAHLEPEILIVDEVLAVGDTEFQKKCLGKLDDVSRMQGRTVLFVSHNMEAVLKLCTQAILIDSGRVQALGDAKIVVPTYLSSQSSSSRVVDLSSRERPNHLTGRARLVRASPSDPDGKWLLSFGQELSLEISIEVISSVNEIDLYVAVFSARGFELATWSNRCNDVTLSVHPGTNAFRIEIQRLRLLPGYYSLGMAIVSDRGYEDWVADAVFFEVTSSQEAAKINAEMLRGAIVASATVDILG